MIISKHILIFAICVLCIHSCIALKGVSDQCCDLAKDSSAFINKTIPQSSYTCGQQYSPTNSPVPDLTVSLSWCRANCAGYALYPPSRTNAWALPLVSFILAAVIFSMTIPRRLGSHTYHLRLRYLVLSLFLDAFILILDTVIWVFTIMIATAPLILSGLFEVIIDIKVTTYASNAYARQELEEADVVELWTAVLAGNLNIEGVPANPQEELKRELDIRRLGTDTRENIGVRLSDILDGQVPFSTTVGAPVLLYLGSFVYSIVSLSGTKGDKDTARALAFGIWWMIIVHVSVISGSLLASNNPSLASIIHPQRREWLLLTQRHEYARKRSQMEDQVQAHIEAISHVPLSYNNRYEPVWMWTRGKNKALWLSRTQAWNHPWFRERINLSAWNWFFLIAVSYFLVFVPCALAFWIEYSTPAIGVGCRALTILIYAACQFIFVLLAAWSHFKAAHGDHYSHTYWQRHPWLDNLRSKGVGIFVAIFILLPTWLASVFTTFAGTLMQITGIYQNCWCAATFHRTIALASDTAQDRNSSWSWDIAGYVAVTFLFVVTYSGWWCQRYLRDVFLERVDHLTNPQRQNPQNQDPQNQDPQNQDPQNQALQHQNPQHQDGQSGNGTVAGVPQNQSAPSASLPLLTHQGSRDAISMGSISRSSNDASQRRTSHASGPSSRTSDPYLAATHMGAAGHQQNATRSSTKSHLPIYQLYVQTAD